MTKKNPHSTPSGLDPLKSASAFVSWVEATLNELHVGIAGGLVPMELVRETRIRCACEELLESAQAMAGSELLVAGSARQIQPHPLLKLMRDLRREITDSLQELQFRAESRALIEQANAITRRSEVTLETSDADPGSSQQTQNETDERKHGERVEA
jgi:hypothetical protein